MLTLPPTENASVDFTEMVQMIYLKGVKMRWIWNGCYRQAERGQVQARGFILFQGSSLCRVTLSSISLIRKMSLATLSLCASTNEEQQHIISYLSLKDWKFIQDLARAHVKGRSILLLRSEMLHEWSSCNKINIQKKTKLV